MGIQNLRTMRCSDNHRFNQIKEQAVFDNPNLLIEPFRQQMRVFDPAKMQIDNVILRIRQSFAAILIQTISWFQAFIRQPL